MHQGAGRQDQSERLNQSNETRQHVPTCTTNLPTAITSDPQTDLQDLGSLVKQQSIDAARLQRALSPRRAHSC